MLSNTGIVLIALLAALLLFCLLVLLWWYVKRKRERQFLRQEYSILETKYKVVGEQQEDFQSSVKYAKRLVDAIFKIGELVEFPQLDYFLLYNPKDIISGDFVWHSSKYDRHYFVVADCTGHGVPGAFMSIVSYNLFNQAVNEFGYHKPSEILHFVNQRHFEIFNSENDQSIKDGMDVGVCVIDMDSELIEYAGAMRPLIIVNAKGEVERIPGDRMSIGEDGYKNTSKFTDHLIDFSSGDTIYLTTDGFADQFGGPNGKKYKSSQLLQLIKEISPLNMDDQKVKIQQSFKDWKQGREQIDDVTILGIRAL